MTQTARNGTALRKALVTQYGLTSAAALALVDVAAQALDQALRAERKLAKEGDCIGGARGLRAHPAVKIAHDARQRMLAALRELDLET